MIEIDTHRWLLTPLSSQYHTIYSQCLLCFPYSMRNQRIRHRHSCRRRSADRQPSWCCSLCSPHPMSSSYQVWSIFSISIECSQEFSQALVAFRFTEKQEHHQYPCHTSGRFQIFTKIYNSYQNHIVVTYKRIVAFVVCVSSLS